MIVSILNFLLQITESLEGLDIPEVVQSTHKAVEFLGLEIMNWEDFSSLVFRFAFNLASAVIIIRGLYYAKAKRKDYLFTYLLINIVIFILCFTLSSVKLQVGFALGLFAVFGIIRYRTDTMPIKEMTYLFVIIGLAVINALASKKISYAELLFANGIIILTIYILENLWLLRHESSKEIIYERIELIKPERRAELLIDLEARTGLKITRLEVGKIDFMRDIARLIIYYYENDVNAADNIGRSSGGDGD